MKRGKIFFLFICSFLLKESVCEGQSRKIEAFQVKMTDVLKKIIKSGSSQNWRKYSSLRYVFILMGCFFVFSCSEINQNSINGEDMYVGVSQKNITPPDNYSHYRGISQGVHDSIFVKAIVFGKEGRERFAIVESDLLYVDRELTTQARLMASAETGIPFSNILIAALHDHSSPSYNAYIDRLNEKNRPEDYVKPKTSQGEEYTEWLSQQMGQAVIDANNHSTPVILEAGLKELDGLAFNRRFTLNNGKTVMNPGKGNPNIYDVAGPVDSSLGILLIRRASDNKPIACFSNFALHADTFTGGAVFSGDYPAFLAKRLKEEFGEEFISIFANGACGDINHIDTRKNSQKIEAEEIGKRIGASILQELEKLEIVKNPKLNSLSRFVNVPLQEFSEKELKWATQHKLQPDSLYNESQFLTKRRAVKIWDLHRRQVEGEAIPPTIGSGPWRLPLEIQVFQIGKDIAIVGLPGEVFTELSMAIKEASPYQMTLVIELTNILLPYVPTEKAFTEGSYETINSRLIPEGGEMMVHTAIQLLQEMNQP